MTRVWVPFFVMLLLGFSLGVEFISHDMTVLIPPDGSPVITEDYQIKLGQNETSRFLEVMNSSDPSSLAEFGTGPSFKVPIQDFHSSYVLGESGFARVTIQYRADVLNKIEDKGATEVVKLDGSDTVFQKEKFELPWKPTTQITIQFPRAYRLASIPQPRPSLQRIAMIPGYPGQFNEYVWRGPLTSDKFVLELERPKSVQKQFSLPGLLDELKYSLMNPVYLITIGIVLALAVIYRKALIDLLKEVFAEEPASEEEA